MGSPCQGTLFLIPVTLGGDVPARVLPPDVVRIVQRLDTFVVENEKTARRFFGLIAMEKPVRELSLATLNVHTAVQDLPLLLAPLLAGRDIGLMSEAGCPGVADPGASLVALAHAHNIRVVPLVGPSSILLALMASGLDGQRFAFLGYLPVEKPVRVEKLREIEQVSRAQRQTQIFIEAPYRNRHLLEDILTTCRPDTRLCVASDLTLDNEHIISRTVADWRKTPLPELHRQPAIFLLLA